MKLFINYVLLKREEVNEFVFNDSCNNRWPTADDFHQQQKAWEENHLTPQQQIIKDYIKHLAEAKHSEESFVIRIVNEINTKIKALTAKNRQGGYWLGADKLPEEVAEEIKDLKKALNFPEYQGFKDELINWYKDPEKTLDKIRKHFADLPIHQWFEIYSYLRNWVNDQNDKNKPFKEVETILDEWVDNTNKTNNLFPKREEIISLQIQILERNETYIKFQWILPNSILKIGEREYKSKIFPNLKHYFFYFDGEWYEVLDWEQKGWNGAEITAEKSIFYNGYWWLLKSGANGYIHHSPIGHQEEFCNCFETDVITSRNSFVCDYELKFAGYRIGKAQGNEAQILRDGGLDIIACGLPIRVNDWNKEKSGVKNFWTRPFTTKYEGVLYLLLNEKLGNEQFKYFSYYKGSPYGELNWKRVGEYDKNKMVSSLSGENHLDFLRSKKLLDDEMYHPLSQHIKATILWRNEPVWQGNYYLIHNNLIITESVSPSGSVITIEGSGIILAQITESISSKLGGDSQTSAWLTTLITVGTTIGAALITKGMSVGAGMVLTAKGAAVGKAAVGLAGAGLNRGINNLLDSPSYNEAKKTMTIHEFKHKYCLSHIRPLSIVLEWNQEALNRYQKNRTLYGISRADAFNVACLGESLLNNAGFLKATIESWNLPDSVFDEWFKRKIQEGVFLEKKANETYLKKLPDATIPTSQGGVVRGAWNEITTTDTVSVGSGWDDISHCGGGFWVYKSKEGRENHITVEGGPHQGTNLLSWLMTTINNNYRGFIVREDSNMWVVAHPNPAFSNFRVDIPDQYKYKEISQGENQSGIKACQINYRLKFFTGGNDSREDFGEGTEINATHMIIHKLVNGNQSKLVIEIKGQHVLINKVSNPENIPLAKTIPVNPINDNIQQPTKPNFNINGPSNNPNPITMVPNSVISSGLGEVQAPLETDQETQTMEEIKQQQGVQFNVNIDTQTQAQVNTQNNTEVIQENRTEPVPQENQNQDENN